MIGRYIKGRAWSSCQQANGQLSANFLEIIASSYPTVSCKPRTMAPAGLILTVALKVFSMTDTSLIVRNATGDCGFSVVQCTTTPEGLEGKTCHRPDNENMHSSFSSGICMRVHGLVLYCRSRPEALQKLSVIQIM